MTPLFKLLFFPFLGHYAVRTLLKLTLPCFVLEAGSKSLRLDMLDLLDDIPAV